MLVTFLLTLAVPEISIDVEIKMKNDRHEVLWRLGKLANSFPQSQRCFSISGICENSSKRSDVDYEWLSC